MRIVKKEFNVYSFNELAPEIQSKVVDNNRYIFTDYNWWQDIYNMAKNNEIAVLLGNNADYSWLNSFSVEGFNLTKNYLLMSGDVNIAKFIEINGLSDKYASVLEFLKNNDGSATITNSTYYENNELDLDIDIDSATHKMLFNEIVSELTVIKDGLYGSLDGQYEWLISDECIIDNLVNSEIQYLSDGTQFHE